MRTRAERTTVPPHDLDAASTAAEAETLSRPSRSRPSPRGIKAQAAAFASSAKRLRVLLCLEASGGGSGRHVADLADGLCANGCDVTLIYGTPRATKPFLERIAAIPQLRSIAHADMVRSVGLKDIAALATLRRFIEAEGPFDILHGHSSKAGGLIRLLPRSIPGARIYTPHAFRTMDPELSAAKRHIFNAMERVLSWRSDVILTGSRQEYDVALAAGIGKARLETIINGIDPPALEDRGTVRARLGLPLESVVVGYVGRFCHQKAPERLVDSAGRLDPAIHFALVGYGEQKADLQRRIDAAGLSKRVHLLEGFDGQASMPAFDLLAVPSRYESMGYIFLEAAVAGLPIISTDVGVARDVIQPGRNGFLVENTDDPACWANAVEAGLRPSIASEARSVSERFVAQHSARQMVSRILAVYLQVSGHCQEAP
ncbi:MAG: glycosyltransferase [Oceanicaulis sp.]